MDAFHEIPSSGFAEVRIDSHRFENKAMNREGVRFLAGSLPVRVETSLWGWFGSIRFGSLQYLIEMLLL